MWHEAGNVRPAIIVGVEESSETRLYIYILRPDGMPELRAETRCGGSGAEPMAGS